MTIQTIKEKIINYCRIDEEKSDREYKKEYEKISEFTFSMDIKSSKLLSFSMIFLILFVLSFIVYFYHLSRTQTMTYDLQVLAILIVIMFFSFLVSFFAFLILGIIGALNENLRFYNFNRIINIYFLELAKEIEPSKKNKAIKNILYNLTRLETKLEFKKARYGILPSYNIKKYLKFKKDDIRALSKIVDKTIEFVNSCLIFLAEKDYSDNFKKLGNLYLKQNYKEILNLIENFEINEKINKRKTFLDFGDSKFIKIANAIRNHGQSFYYIVIIILTILFYLGIIQLPPATGL